MVKGGLFNWFNVDQIPLALLYQLKLKLIIFFFQTRYLLFGVVCWFPSSLFLRRRSRSWPRRHHFGQQERRLFFTGPSSTSLSSLTSHHYVLLKHVFTLIKLKTTTNHTSGIFRTNDSKRRILAIDVQPIINSTGFRIKHTELSTRFWM